MDFTHYSDQSVQAAAGLVNTRGLRSGTEEMATLAGAEDFLRMSDFSGFTRLTKRDLVELHLLRELLESVFYAPNEKTAARRLNDLLDDYDVRPYLTDHDGRWHMHYSPEGTATGRRVATYMVMGLASLVADFGFDRLGICAADDCDGVFVDTSRNNSRRYCSNVCSSRMNVAAHRARAKARTA